MAERPWLSMGVLILGKKMAPKDLIPSEVEFLRALEFPLWEE
jgi:hypothetical protein